MENDKVCTLIINGDKKVQPTPMDIQKKIEAASSIYMQKKDPKKLVEAMEELLLFMVNGNSYPKLLMTIIRFVITCDDHRVKKLCQLYWEICEKVRENGELKEEMVLVCNAIRNDLIHSNEYIRGRTLRLLCRMRYFKIMEPLVESVLKNLSHRHAYVRRNAVTCVYSIVKTFGPDVIPQASVEIEQLLLVEGDLSTKRIAFIMLLNCDIDRAIAYAISVEEQVTSLGDVFQLALLELVRKVAKTRPGHKARLMKLVFYLANASSPAVMFECAQILSSLASSPSATQIAAGSYVNLINSQPDNNVKLIVLDHLEGMSVTDRHVVENLVMDILRGLSCPAIGVRSKIISIATSVLTSRNVADVVTFLRKEIAKTQAPENEGNEDNTAYRRLLIQTLQDACRQFSELAESVIVTLTDILRDKRTDQATGLEIIVFLRELVVTTKGLQKILVENLSLMLPQLSRSRVLRMALWLIGEYTAPSDAGVAVERILKSLGPLPLVSASVMSDADVDKEESGKVVSEEEPASNTMSTRTIVLADGTYASQAVYSSNKGASSAIAGIRNLLVGGDILLASLTGVVLAKLTLRSSTPGNAVLFALTCLVRLVKQALPFGGKEHIARLMHCLRVVAEPDNVKLRAVCMREWSSVACREALTRLVASDTALRVKRKVVASKREVAPPTMNVAFRVLKTKRDLLAETDHNLVALDLQHDKTTPEVVMESSIPGVMNDIAVSPPVFSNRLAKAVPMTGLADAVYIEGYLRLNSYDLILELSIVNRTSETLQNILVELCAHGDLKVVEKPTAVTLGPGESQTVYSTIKVSSTENGILFGYATYDRKSEKEWMVLNEVRADVLDYIQPHCSVGESEFKVMWQDFEWENKIVVNTTSTMPEFIKLLSKHTNLTLVGGQQVLSSQFAAMNLYAKSIFGEDALANVSLERLPGDALVGTVRIRSRTQGIALSLGDKVSHMQKDQKMSRGA